MNNTDQAFIKAYSKLPGAQRQEKHVEREPRASAHYIDPSAEAFYRTESAHASSGPHRASKGPVAEQARVAGASPVSGSGVPRSPERPGTAAHANPLPSSAGVPFDHPSPHAPIRQVAMPAAGEARQTPTPDELLAYPPTSAPSRVVQSAAGDVLGQRISANGVNAAYPIADTGQPCEPVRSTPADETAHQQTLQADEALESMRQGAPIVVAMRWESSESDRGIAPGDSADAPRPWARSVAIDEPAVAPKTAPPRSSSAAADAPSVLAAGDAASAEQPEVEVTNRRPAESPRLEQEKPQEPTAGELAQQAEQSDPAQPAFRAVWEVDQFACSETIELVHSQLGQQLREVGRELARSSRQGLGCLAVTGLDRGVGTTTVAVQLARAAADAGVRVALVDANYTAPGLCDALGVEAEQGWDDALAGSLPVAEAAVQSIADDLTLVPLCPVASRGRSEAAGRIAELLDHIAGQFELIIVDTGAVNDAFASDSQQLDGSLVDAAMIVGESAEIAARGYGDAADHLRRAGIARIGLIENFCTP